MYWPPKTAHGIAAIEGARQQHILRANQDVPTLRGGIPSVTYLASHEYVYVKTAFLDDAICNKPINSLYGDLDGLFNEGTHRQTVHQTSSNTRRIVQPTPEPCTKDSGSFASSCWHVDERIQ